MLFHIFHGVCLVRKINCTKTRPSHTPISQLPAIALRNCNHIVYKYNYICLSRQEFVHIFQSSNVFQLLFKSNQMVYNKILVLSIAAILHIYHTYHQLYHSFISENSLSVHCAVVVKFSELFVSSLCLHKYAVNLFIEMWATVNTNLLW